MHTLFYFLFSILFFSSWCAEEPDLEKIIQNYMNFTTYVKKFDKNYNQTQYLYRQQLYDDKIQYFKTVQGYKPGINQFTDMTPEQVTNFKRLQENTQNAQYKPNNQMPSLTVGSIQYGIPTSKDWRNQGAVSSVKNQGTCGSCWSFAAVAYSQSKLIIEKKADKGIDLSQQFLLQCTANSNCDGGTLQSVFGTIVKKKGLPQEKQYPYSPYTIYSGICYEPNVINVGQSVVNMRNLDDNQIISLLQTGPIAISVSADGWQNYGSGIFSCSQTAKISHAVLLIGYGKDYWVIKNQWSSNWGQQGYIRVTRNANKNCKIGTTAHFIEGSSNYFGKLLFSSFYQTGFLLFLTAILIILF